MHKRGGKTKGGREGGRDREAEVLLTKRVKQGASGVALDLGRLLLQGGGLDDEEGVYTGSAQGELAPEGGREGGSGGESESV